MSPTANPRPRRGTCQGGPACVGDVAEVARRDAEQELGRHLVRDRGAEVGDVPVGLDQVEPAVVVGVERGQAESEEPPGGGGQARGGRSVAEQPTTVVVVERGRLVEEVGDGQVETTVAVEVAAGNPHPGQGSPLRAGRQARLRRLLGEPEAAEVAEEEIRREVVGHEHVDLAVVVEVGGDDAQAAAVAVDDAGLRGHVDEPAAVVAEDVVRQRGEGGRVAVHIARLGAIRILAEGRILGVPLAGSGRRRGRGRRRCRSRPRPPTWASRGRPRAPPAPWRPGTGPRPDCDTGHRTAIG